MPRSWSPRQGRVLDVSHGHPEDGKTVAPHFEQGDCPVQSCGSIGNARRHWNGRLNSISAGLLQSTGPKRPDVFPAQTEGLGKNVPPRLSLRANGPDIWNSCTYGEGHRTAASGRHLTIGAVMRAVMDSANKCPGRWPLEWISGTREPGPLVRAGKTAGHFGPEETVHRVPGVESFARPPRTSHEPPRSDHAYPGKGTELTSNCARSMQNSCTKAPHFVRQCPLWAPYFWASAGKTPAFSRPTQPSRPRI